MLGAGMTLVDRLAILYLALPVALFFFTWFKPIFGIPFGLAALAGLALLWPLPASKLPVRILVLAAILALLWSSLSGAGHFFFAGVTTNWPTRDAVLHDLVMLNNPPVYRLQDGLATTLRAPIAYYIVPAMLGRIAGMAHAHFLLYLWTAAGVLLFLLQVIAGEQRWKPLLLIAAVVVLFSGMNILAPPDTGLDPTTHLRWQVLLYQSTYNTSLLFDFPSHAIPGWLTIALLYRCQDDERFLRIAGWVGALTLLWAPLVSIGLLPFFFALAWRHLRAGSWRPLFSACNLVAAPLVAFPTALFLTAAAGAIGSAGLPPPNWQEFLPVYVPFMAIQFGALALALLLASRESIQPMFFGLAVLSLLVLPWFHFGPHNDLVTRGSIPAMTVIMFTVVDGWARPCNLTGRGLIVTIMLIIGAVMPIVKMHLVLTEFAWKPDLERSLYMITGGASPNYLADIPRNSVLGRMLEEPTPPGG
jgi:hypothetical protein